MSLLSSQIPRANYIVFQLVEIDTEKQTADSSYKATQRSIINLAIMPEQLNYRLVSRDSLTQTSHNVYLQKYSMQPEKVRFNGTFGDDFQVVNGASLDGWQRLKIFEEEIVRQSKNVDSTTKIYAVNYYDFAFQRFGSINIDSWNLNGNAKSNSNLVTYSLDFTIIDRLIDVNTLDAFIKNLISNVFLGGSPNLSDILLLSAVNLTSIGNDLINSVDTKFKEILNKFTGVASQPGNMILKKVENLF